MLYSRLPEQPRLPALGTGSTLVVSSIGLGHAEPFRRQGRGGAPDRFAVTHQLWGLDSPFPGLQRPNSAGVWGCPQCPFFIESPSEQEEGRGW